MLSVECEIILLLEFDLGALWPFIKYIVAPDVHSQRFAFKVFELLRQLKLEDSALFKQHFDWVVLLYHYEGACGLSNHQSLKPFHLLIGSIDHFNTSAWEVSFCNLGAQSILHGTIMGVETLNQLLRPHCQQHCHILQPQCIHLLKCLVFQLLTSLLMHLVNGLNWRVTQLFCFFILWLMLLR